MSEFTCLLGEPALSDFRKRKLVRRISGLSDAGRELEARFVYLVESGTIPNHAEVQALQDLLHGDAVTSLDASDLLLVVPRMGTQSPWSTKATDISMRCSSTTRAVWTSATLMPKALRLTV